YRPLPQRGPHARRDQCRPRALPPRSRGRARGVRDLWWLPGVQAGRRVPQGDGDGARALPHQQREHQDVGEPAVHHGSALGQRRGLRPARCALRLLAWAADVAGRTSRTRAPMARPRSDGRGRGPRRNVVGRRTGGLWGVLFVAPQPLLFVAFFLVPVVIAFALAFMEVRPTRMSFVGLENFETVLGDRLFRRAVINTTVFTAVVVLFWLGKALLIAYLLDPMNPALQTFFKSAFYLPAVTSGVIISLVWLWIYHPN